MDNLKNCKVRVTVEAINAETDKIEYAYHGYLEEHGEAYYIFKSGARCELWIRRFVIVLKALLILMKGE